MEGCRVMWPEANRVELERFALPPLKPDEVLVRTEFSVVSAGTERAFFTAMPNTSDRFPQYPGYSAVGSIIQVGEREERLRIGDRVICCHTGHASHAIVPAEGLVAIEDDAVSSLDAAFTVIASFSLGGLRKACPELGESVLVMGQGLLGLFAVQLCRLNGCLPVIAADGNEARRGLALELGADYAFDPGEPGFQSAVAAATRQRGVNMVIEVSGAARALNQALTCTARQGRVVLLGCTRVSSDSIDFYRDVHKPGISIIGAHNYVRPSRDSYPGHWTRQDDYRTLLRLFAAGRLKTAPMISEIVSPEEAPRVYRRLAKDASAPLGIVFDWTRMEEWIR